MFKQTVRVLFPAVLACSLVGCGTMQNLHSSQTDRPMPYGGVSADLNNCEHSFDHPNLPHGWFPGEMLVVGTCQVGKAGFWLIDVPFSAIGDTVTLPWTTGVTGKREPTVYAESVPAVQRQ